MRTSEDSVSQVMSDAFMKNLDLCEEMISLGAEMGRSRS